MWTGLLLKQNKTQTSWEINKTGRKSVWLSPAIFWPLNNDFCPPTNQISTIFSLWKWNNQHITSVGERKNPSLRQDSNLWPPKHRAGALPSELRRTHGQRGHILGSYLTRVLHTARISNVEIVLHDERMRGGESSNHVCKSSAKIIPVQNNFLNKFIF